LNTLKKDSRVAQIRAVENGGHSCHVGVGRIDTLEVPGCSGISLLEARVWGETDE